MVALALFALIVIAIYQTWYSIMKGSKVALDAAAAAQRSRIAMRTLQDSLACACMYSQNIQYYTFLVDSDNSDGDFASLSFVARLPKSFPHGEIRDLDIRRVSFTVEEGPIPKNNSSCARIPSSWKWIGRKKSSPRPRAQRQAFHRPFHGSQDR